MEPQTKDVRWHAMDTDAVLARLDSNALGLNATQARERLAAHGPNRLAEPARSGLFIRLAKQFHNLLIYALLASALGAALLGHGVDASVILGVVVINAIIGVVQEGRAERALAAIGRMLTPTASVLRDGRRMALAAEDVVPGDIVLLEAGDRVCADVRILRARNLQAQEAILTGESVPVEKGAATVAPQSVLAERSSMAYSGTMVTSGAGVGAVIATGADTELGRISTLLGSVEAVTTPLLRRMDRLARILTFVILAMAAAVFALAVGWRGYSAADAFMAMVGMAVAAIPEGLPAVMTITLAVGVQRMAARNAIVRRLPAVETLGSVTVICTDKTGTLTRNEMTVRAAAGADGGYSVDGVGYEPVGAVMAHAEATDSTQDPILDDIMRAALLCNDAALVRAEDGRWVVRGDPMEGALVSFAIKAGADPDLMRRQFPRSDEIPFDARHRFMATLHHDHAGTATIYVKGAPEQLLEMCVSERGPAGAQPINSSAWSARVDQLAARGMRVLALATKPADAGARELRFADTSGELMLLGLLGLIDPPRPEAVAAIAECRSAGIRVKMITGDHPETARAIARELGLETRNAAVTGRTIDNLDDTTLARVAWDNDVFARTDPEHKLRLVRALQADGAIVAMTGDGVNDAPALKQADIGVAMGNNGTEVAKEAAAMVLADDNFASIVAAVREGRTIHDNIQKMIAWTLPTNGGESLCIIGAVLLGITLPFTAVQILWINMVTTVGLGLTLAFEPTEPDVMRRHPRRADAPLISGVLVWRTILVSILFVAAAFGVFVWTVERGLPIESARTLVVNVIVVMEIFYLFSVRYRHESSLTLRGMLGTPAVLSGVGAIVALQLAFTYAPPMNKLFDTRPVALTDGLAVIAIGVALLILLEIEKRVRNRILERRRAG